MISFIMTLTDHLHILTDFSFIKASVFSNNTLIIIYTDHSVTLDIVKQIFLTTFFTDKLNLCFVQVSQYIQLFCFRIFHKSEKTHLISDILFRLSSSTFSNDIDILNALHVNAHSEFVYIVTMIKLSADFKKCLKNDYIRNHCF